MFFARKSLCIGGIIALISWSSVAVFAGTNSGIDLNQSTIQIDYVPDSKAQVSTYTCLGESSPISPTTTVINGTDHFLSDALGYFNDGGVTKSEKIARIETDLEIDLKNMSGTPLEQCFKNAGTYTVTVKLMDVVGNINTKVFNFKIMPADVDANSITTNSYSGASANCNDVSADGLSICSVDIVLRDQFENIVYEVENAVIGFEQPNSTGDANLGLKFIAGLEETSSSIIGRTNESQTFSDGILTLDFRAFAPTVTITNELTVEQEKPYNIDIISVPALENNGSVSVATNTLNGVITPELMFKRPIYIPISVEPGRLTGYGAGGVTADPGQLGGNFSLLGATETPNTLEDHRVKVSLQPSILPSPIVHNSFSPTNIRGAFTQTSDDLDYFRTLSLTPENIIRMENINATSINTSPSTDAHSFLNTAGTHTGLGFTKTALSSNSNAENPNNYFRLNGSSLGAGIFEYILNFAAPNSTSNLIPEFNFQSLVQYNINQASGTKTVRYYAGNSVDTSDTNLGVFIEGTVIKRDENTKVLSNDLSVMAGVSQKDIRETITRNAIALAREGESIESDYNFDANDFDSSRNVIIVKNANVEISGKLPEGENTLIVIDGNVLISGNTYYDKEAMDSFGLIALSTNTTTAPEKGNIFVNADVQNIRGAFYADGGMIGTKSGTNLGDIDDFDEVEFDSGLQLRLIGTLLTKNTIGGAGKAGAAITEFQYPWGVTTDKELAKRYDLLFLRTPFQLTQTACLQIAEFNNPSSQICDTVDTPNPNSEKGYSFILRFDRKVLEQSPPGFTQSQTINH